MRWRPEEFWSSNVPEAMDAWEGYARAAGLRKRGGSQLTEADVTDLRRMIEEHGNA